MFERCLRKAISNGVLVIVRQLRRNNIFWKVSLIPMSPEWDNKWKLFNTKIRPALIVSDHCDTVSLPWETQRQN